MIDAGLVRQQRYSSRAARGFRGFPPGNWTHFLIYTNTLAKLIIKNEFTSVTLPYLLRSLSFCLWFAVFFFYSLPLFSFDILDLSFVADP